MIDAAIVIGVSENPHEPLPLFIKDKDGLLKSAGTKYSNAHPLKILYEGKETKRIAIVGTPCTLQALQKVNFYPLNKPLYNNIVLKIGLFCMESFDYKEINEIIATEFHKNIKDIIKMDINKGKFIIYDNNSDTYEIPIHKIRGYARYGCFPCGDLTSELADISVGSIGSEEKWSTVIIRTSIGENLFNASINSGSINSSSINFDTKEFISIQNIAKSKIKRYKEISKQGMIEQLPEVRRHNFKEVPKGYTAEMAKLEASRCLRCGEPLCIKGCSVNVDIPSFIKLIKSGKIQESIRCIKDYNLLPAVCGRVCPQESQCEGMCLLGKIDDPVSIGNLERYVADWERANNLRECPECQPPNNIKVAVIGCGPAGLTCAADLAKKGYDITIFEAFHKGGGVLAYGIPEFRLPKEIVDYEIETLEELGVKLEYNMVMGKVLTIQDLYEMDIQAIFIGIGAGLPMFLNVPGKNLKGVVSANEYLTRANLMKAYQFPKFKTPIVHGKNICVIGGGNVAMDSARSALRFGAKSVTIVYRRAMEQLPARKEEVRHAMQEGVIFKLLTNPVRYIGDIMGNVEEMEVLQMKLGEPDASGRARPIPIENSEFRIKCDLIIVAIGNNSNPLLTSTIPDLELNRWGNIVVDESGKTSIDGIYAAGDIVSGAATVISAMGTGRKAAKGIHEYLQSR